MCMKVCVCACVKEDLCMSAYLYQYEHIPVCEGICEGVYAFESMCVKVCVVCVY